MTVPSLEEFLAAPDVEVAKVAPQTILYAPAGTRRRALLDGIPLDQYSSTSMKELLQVAQMFFRLGVRNLIVPSLGSSQLAEVPAYSQKIAYWIAEQVMSDSVIHMARSCGFSIRLIGLAKENEQVLKDAQLKLETCIADMNVPILWMHVIKTVDDPWQEIIQSIRRSSASTRAELVRELYGRDIPPARIFIGFGRMMLYPEIIPLLLFQDRLHCYWTEKAGFRITERMIRSILYDAVFLRDRGDAENREQRYEYLDALKIRWESESIIGVGERVFGFWLPRPFPQEQQEG